MDKLTRLVYRSTLRSAMKLDSRPALQALIHRNVQRKLPEDFSSVLSVFLRSPHRVFFMPSLLPGPTVAQTIRDAFRFPPGVPNIDSGMMGMRFLTGILQLAEKHGLLAKPQQSSAISPAENPSTPQVRLQALPEQGCILVSHPLLYSNHNFFYQTVVLLCQHSLNSGTYGLVLNKLMSSKEREFFGDMSQHMNAATAALTGAPLTGAGGGLDLARDLPAALQALMDHTARNNTEEGFEIDLAGQQQHPSASSSSSDDEMSMEFEVSASDSDAETIDVTFSTSESPEPAAVQSAETSFETTASQLTPSTSYTPASNSVETDQQQQPEQLQAASQTQEQQPQHLASASEALSQQPTSTQSVTQGDTEWPGSNQAPAGDQQAPHADAQQPIMGADGAPSKPSSSQGQDQLIWHARLKPPPASRDRLEPRQSKHTAADPAGDIADPHHPFRFHQVVSSLRRTVTPVDPVQATAQPQPGNSAQHASNQDHASSSGHATQELGALNRANNVQSSTTEHAQPEQEAIPAGMHHAHSPTDNLTVSVTEPPNSAADSWHGQADEAGASQQEAVQAGGAGQDVSRSGGGFGEDVLHKSTISRGGPVPGTQQLHRAADLGGNVVQEPTSTCPGLYLGMDLEQAKKAEAAGKLSPADIRFFLGESSWVSQQLEQEVAQGSWLLLSPDPQLLQDLVLQPHQFANWSNDGADNDDKLRLAVRQSMWQRVLTGAGNAFADLSHIPKPLVKDLQKLKY